MMGTQKSATSTVSGAQHPASQTVVRQALESAGCRYTAQRGAVYAHLAAVDTHPTVEEVYRSVSGPI